MKSASKIVVDMKREMLMLVPVVADSFRDTNGIKRSLDWDDDVNFRTFNLPEERYERLVLKNFGKRIPEAEIPKELDALQVNVQIVV
jgi:hypothetical protein